MKTKFLPGKIIEIDCGTFWHWAIISDRSIEGFPMLISLSKRTGTVKEEPWQTCVGDRAVRVSQVQSQLPFTTVLANARFYIDKLNWDFWRCNCEHFARAMHGLKPECKQLQRLVWGVGLTTLAYLATRVAKK